MANLQPEGSATPPTTDIPVPITNEAMPIAITVAVSTLNAALDTRVDAKLDAKFDSLLDRLNLHRMWTQVLQCP